MATAEDLKALQDLAMWCRKEGFRLGDVRLGSITVRLRDMRQEEVEPLREAAKDPTIWEQHGLDENGVPNDGTAG
jgi:hypothetical protein